MSWSVQFCLKWGGKLFFQRQIQLPENHKILIMSGSDEPPIIRDENFSGKTESAFQLVIVKNLRQDEFQKREKFHFVFFLVIFLLDFSRSETRISKIVKIEYLSDFFVGDCVQNLELQIKITENGQNRNFSE